MIFSFISDLQLGVAHADPFLWKLGPEIAIFRSFYNFFHNFCIKTGLLILTESATIFHWKSAKKCKVGVVLG